MPPVDLNEPNDLKMIAASIPLPNNSNNLAQTNDSCTKEVWRKEYNREVAVLTNKLADVRACLASIDKMQTEVSRATCQNSHTLSAIERRLAARPPATAPGTVLPIDMYVQTYRDGYRRIETKRFAHTVDVVMAHCIPQSKQHEIYFNQIIPVYFLAELGAPFQGKNGSQLYSLLRGRRNSRVQAHLIDESVELYGDVLWVPSPLETESWLPLTIEKPSQDIVQSAKILHSHEIYRFTIDTMHNGGLFLSFAKEGDQLMAKMAL